MARSLCCPTRLLPQLSVVRLLLEGQLKDLTFSTSANVGTGNRVLNPSGPISGYNTSAHAHTHIPVCLVRVVVLLPRRLENTCRSDCNPRKTAIRSHDYPENNPPEGESSSTTIMQRHSYNRWSIHRLALPK